MLLSFVAFCFGIIFQVIVVIGLGALLIRAVIWTIFQAMAVASSLCRSQYGQRSDVGERQGWAMEAPSFGPGFCRLDG